MKEFVENQRVSFKMQKPLPQHWTNISIGKTDYKICALANTRDKWIGVQLVISGKEALSNFDKLRVKYEFKSKEDLGAEIDWLEKEGGKEHHINYIFHNNNPMDKAEWSNQHQLLCDWVEKFYKYFTDKVKSI